MPDSKDIDISSTYMTEKSHKDVQKCSSNNRVYGFRYLCLMRTVRLKISDSVFEKFQLLISRFDKGEIELLSEEREFLSTQKYLQNELSEVQEGKAEYHSQEELDARLDKVIRKYENRL